MCGPDDTALEFVAKGTHCDVVHGIRSNGRMLAREFLQGLRTNEQARFYVDFQSLCDSGRLPSSRLAKFRTKMGVAWEFRNGPWRIGTFQHGRYWVLTHGFRKTGRRTQPGQIDKIERIRAEHVARIGEKEAE